MACSGSRGVGVRAVDELPCVRCRIVDASVVVYSGGGLRVVGPVTPAPDDQFFTCPNLRLVEARQRGLVRGVHAVQAANRGELRDRQGENPIGLAAAYR